MKRTFGFSRLEIFLGAAVFLGLAYMVYLFGVASPVAATQGSRYLDETAQKTVSGLVHNQIVNGNLTGKLLKMFDRLPKPPKDEKNLGMDQVKVEELKKINEYLAELATTNALMQARLSELSRLLPPPGPQKESKKTK